MRRRLRGLHLAGPEVLRIVLSSSASGTRAGPCAKRLMCRSTGLGDHRIEESAPLGPPNDPQEPVVRPVLRYGAPLPARDRRLAEPGHLREFGSGHPELAADGPDLVGCEQPQVLADGFVFEASGVAPR